MSANDSSILGRVMLAFEGSELPTRIADRLAAAPAAGMTLFRPLNVRSPGQVRELTAAFQGAGGADEWSPMLVAADQEAGQFIALGDATTPFAGNMALGAADDIDLTERVGRAIGLEARAMGVNVVYAPSLDIASNPDNPAIGVRSFGDRPRDVTRHGLAFVRGLRSAGVAAAVKHFPGIGDLSGDTHHGLSVVDVPRSVLDVRELAPFRAAFAAGDEAPGLVMSGHAALPAIDGRSDLPSTLSRAVMTDLLRGDLGFDGLVISDALDMGAITGGAYGGGVAAGVPDVVTAVRAGIDLLLTTADDEARARIEGALVEAAGNGAFDAGEVAATERRIAALRTWLGSRGPAPDLSVIRSDDHQDLAAELAARSITIHADARLPWPPDLINSTVVAVMPQPADLTPADTSSSVEPWLGPALRASYADVDEIVTALRPTPSDITAIRHRARGAGCVVVGTIDAHRHPEQFAMVDAIAATGVFTIAVALRGPWDLAGYPDRATAIATYSILPPSMMALVDVIAGRASATGRLPVTITA